MAPREQQPGEPSRPRHWQDESRCHRQVVLETVRKRVAVPVIPQPQAPGHGQPPVVADLGAEQQPTQGLDGRGERLLAPSGFGLTRPIPTAIQVSARETSVSSPTARIHSRAMASVERQPMATATAPTRTTLIRHCNTLPMT